MQLLIILIALSMCLPLSASPDAKKEGFSEDWSNGIVNGRWLALRKQWGEGNNGCVPELISFEDDVVDGVKKKVLVLTMQGTKTKSSINGVTKVEGGYIDSTKPQKVGAMIATADYFASGSYEVKMKIGKTNDTPPKPPVGIVPTIHFFHYEEHPAGKDNPDGSLMNPLNPLYQPRYRESLEEEGYYSAVNAEIDAPEIKFNDNGIIGSYNTYLSTVQSSINIQKVDLPDILDGKYHTFRTEWHTKLVPTDLKDDQVSPRGFYYYAANSPDSLLQGWPVVKKADCKWYVYQGASVTYYLDGKKIAESTEKVPFISCRVNIGGWFADWAGIPDWDEVKMYVSNIKITPFNDEGDVLNQPESFPVDGLVPLNSKKCAEVIK